MKAEIKNAIEKIENDIHKQEAAVNYKKIINFSKFAPNFFERISKKDIIDTFHKFHIDCFIDEYPHIKIKLDVRHNDFILAMKEYYENVLLS